MMSMDLHDLKAIRRSIRKRLREWEKQKKQVEREMKAIRVDIERLYPNPDLVEAISVLIDPDLIWSGDFDDLRMPLSELLLKLHACGVFTDDVDRLVDIIVYSKQV